MLTLMKDSWLSTTLQREAFRVVLSSQSTTEDGHEKIANLSKGSFLYSKISTDDLQSVRQLESIGLRIVETALTFELQEPNIMNEKCGNFFSRHATAADQRAVAALAEESFTNSRFHKDPEIKSYADQIKREWAENYFLGKRGDQLVLAESKGKIVGFLQLLVPDASLLVIDLIAVSHEVRGQGLAKAMIAFACNCGSRYEKVRVGTQAHNIPSVRLYEGLGFRLVDSAFVLHYHHKT